MPRRVLWGLAALAALLALSPPRARAAGLGIYGGGAEGSASDWWSEDLSTRHRELGFVLDTAVGGRSVFNYRLQIGYDRLDADSNDDWDLGSDAELGGLVLDHTFGFRLFQGRAVRVWLGPQVRVAWYRGHGSYADGVGGRYRTDIDLTAFGFGPALGLDWNLAPGLTLGVNGGWRVVFYGGSEDAQTRGGPEGGDYDGFTEGLWYLDLSVLLHLGDGR